MHNFCFSCLVFHKSCIICNRTFFSILHFIFKPHITLYLLKSYEFSYFQNLATLYISYYFVLLFCKLFNYKKLLMDIVEFLLKEANISWSFGLYIGLPIYFETTCVIYLYNKAYTVIYLHLKKILLLLLPLPLFLLFVFIIYL